jgi:hypothetical protein
MPAKRNYRKEYRDFQGRPSQIKRRAERNASRAKMVKAGRARKGDGKDVDHKDHNTANQSWKNLRVMSRSRNRAGNQKGRPA